MAGGVAADDLSLASKVLTSPEVRNLSLPAAKNLLVLQDLPQVHPLVKSLFPEDLQCRYPLAGRLKYFRKNWEKLSSNKLYCFELQDVWSILSKQIPKASANVQGEISVSGYRNPDTLRERGNQNDRFKSGQIFELHLFSRKETFKPEGSHWSEKLEPAFPLQTFQNGIQGELLKEVDFLCKVDLKDACLAVALHEE